MANVFREVTTAELLFLAVLSITWLLAATSTHAAEGKEKPAGDGTTASESVEPDLVWRQSLNSHYSARSLEKLIANENILGSVTFPERNMFVAKGGGLATRLMPDEDIGRIFQRHRFQATFTVLNPAKRRDDPAYRDMLMKLVRMGHDVAYWDARSASCLQLYDPNDLTDFQNLDRSPEVWDEAAGGPLLDEYGYPKTGIAEVMQLRGETYLGLTNVLKYQSDDDVVVRPIDGTDRIAFDNLPVANNLTLFYVYFPEGEPTLPEAVRGKWVCAGKPSQQSPIEDREFPVTLYEAIALADYAGGEVFTNPSGRTFTTRVALHMRKEAGSYTEYLHIPGYSSYPNQRTRFYKYVHALRSFYLMGLPRPFTVGEPRCKYEDYCLSEAPLKRLGYIAGGVDPQQKGHTYHMQDHLRYRFATVGNPGSTEPIDPSGTGNGIGFNRNYFDHGEDFDYVGFALSRIAQSAAKNRIHTERQTVPYTEREKGFWDRLLQECRERDLPVLSMRQAATMLFDHIADDGNPVPRVDVDRDGDGLPDGYQQLPPGSNYGQEAEEGLRGANFHHFRRQGPGPFFSIKWMGGIRPGRSRVRVWARGVPGDRLRITLTLYVYKHVEGDRYGNRMSTETVELPVALDSPGWKLYDAGEIDKHPNCYFNDMDVSAETASRTLYVSQVVIQ